MTSVQRSRRFILLAGLSSLLWAIPDRLYRVLATTEGVNRAFEKLDQIRPYITWWLTSEEARRILTSNSVLMMGLVPVGEIPVDGVVFYERRHQYFALSEYKRFRNHYSWGTPRHFWKRHLTLNLVTWLNQPAQRQVFANAWQILEQNLEKIPIFYNVSYYDSPTSYHQ